MKLNSPTERFVASQLTDDLGSITALSSAGPAPDRAAQMMLYGQFIGSWDGTVIVHRPHGECFESTAEVHFGWALAVYQHT